MATDRSPVSPFQNFLVSAGPARVNPTNTDVFRSGRGQLLDVLRRNSQLAPPGLTAEAGLAREAQRQNTLSQFLRTLLAQGDQASRADQQIAFGQNQARASLDLRKMLADQTADLQRDQMKLQRRGQTFGLISSILGSAAKAIPGLGSLGSAAKASAG